MNEQLNLCIVFDFGSHDHLKIEQLSNYTEFKKALKIKVEQEFADWQFIDTKIEAKAKYNK